MKIKGNFKVDKYKITGFEQSESAENNIAMKLNGYLVCEFDKNQTFEFVEAMMGKEYWAQVGYDKARFEDEYQDKIDYLKGALLGQVAFVLKKNGIFEDVVGLTGVNAYDELVAKDTDELFTNFEELREENEETL